MLEDRPVTSDVAQANILAACGPGKRKRTLHHVLHGSRLCQRPCLSKGAHAMHPCAAVRTPIFSPYSMHIRPYSEVPTAYSAFLALSILYVFHTLVSQMSRPSTPFIILKGVSTFGQMDFGSSSECCILHPNSLLEFYLTLF